MSLMPGAQQAEELIDGMVDDLFEDGLTDLERRRELERSGRVAADIEMDIAARGPLFQYLKARRSEALAALEALVSVDPKDAVSIAKAQAAVAEYLKPCHWVAARREEAANAAEIIKEDYPADGDQADRDEQD